MPADARDYLVALSTASAGRSLSEFMAKDGTVAQLREFLIHRSAYQLKEADTSAGAMSRYSDAMSRLGISETGRRFYDVHLIADKHHGELALNELVDGCLADQPEADQEIAFGAAALTYVEAAFSLPPPLCVGDGRTSLRPGGSGPHVGPRGRHLRPREGRFSFLTDLLA